MVEADLETVTGKATKKEEFFSEQLRSLNTTCKEAEARSQFVERSVQKLQKEVDKLENNIAENLTEKRISTEMINLDESTTDVTEGNAGEQKVNIGNIEPDAVDEINEVKLSCHICLITFTKRCSLIRHVYEKHSWSGPHPIQLLPLSCDQCPANHTEKGSLSNHEKAKHLEYNNTSTYTSRMENIPIRGTALIPGKEGFNCDNCYERNHNKPSLKCHTQDNHEGICDVIDFGAYEEMKKQKIAIHMQDDHLGILKVCKECEASLTARTELNTHDYSFHTNNSPKFTHQGNLQAHIITVHSLERAHCQHCTCTFKSFGPLNNHVEIHPQVETSKCPHCVQAFAVMSIAMARMKIHHKLSSRQQQPSPCCQYRKQQQHVN